MASRVIGVAIVCSGLKSAQLCGATFRFVRQDYRVGHRRLDAKGGAVTCFGVQRIGYILRSFRFHVRFLLVLNVVGTTLCGVVGVRLSRDFIKHVLICLRTRGTRRSTERAKERLKCEVWGGMAGGG